MNLEELRARLGQPVPPITPSGERHETGMLDATLSGATFDGPEGEYFAVESVRRRDDTHGRYGFHALIDTQTARLPVVTGDLRSTEVDLKNVAFIDTETTGLGSGVGTQVFLVGIGSLDGDSFKVRQFLLRHPGEERAVMAAICRYLTPFSTLISYNGRSFDWPLLENRFIMQRLWSSPLQPAHVDLLYTARRLWKRRLDSCGLAGVEQSILGVRRTDQDVEGWLIPQLYFRYLRTGDAGPLRRIFYHNLLDICSLALLTVHVHQMLLDPWTTPATDPIDFVSLSRIYELLGQPNVAIDCLSTALEHSLPRRIETEAWLRLALIHKRQGNWDKAVPLFDKVLSRDGFERIACVELAKYHEHVARDAAVAMRHTVRALRSNDLGRVSWPGTHRMELHHRWRRLQRKLAPSAAA